MSQPQSLSILVIDPDDETSQGLKETLASEGYRVSTLTDPSLAREELRSNRYQLVIIDVSPENDAGIEALAKLRSADSDLCIIATTEFPTVEMAVSAMKCGLLPLAQTSMRFARIAYHDYEGVAVNLEEQARLVRDLGDHAGMILRNHGLLVVGASIPEAFNSIFRLERACQVQIAALSCNTELQMPSKKVVDASYRMYLPETRRRFGVLEWPALLAKLDKLDPSYRN